MGGTRVYIGGLPYGVREKDLERFFKGYGRIRDILIKNGYGFVEFDDYRDADDAVYELNGKDLLGERVIIERARGVPRDGGDRGGSGGGGGGGRDSRDSRGFGSRSGGRGDRDGGGGGGGFGGRRGPPRSADKYGPPTRTEYRLTVENLSSRVSWQDLKDYMRQAGEVTYADAHKQRRNEGVVEFATYSDLKAALEKLDDTELNGRRIRLVEDRGGRSRKSRSRSRDSRSRSKSRSRSSRSKSRDSRSKSKSKSRSRSRSRSKSRSRDRDSRSKSKSSRSKSRSVSPDSGKKKKDGSVERGADEDKTDLKKEEDAAPSDEK